MDGVSERVCDWEAEDDRVCDLEKLPDTVCEGEPVEVLQVVRVIDTDAMPDFDSLMLLDGEREALKAELADGVSEMELMADRVWELEGVSDLVCDWEAEDDRVCDWEADDDRVWDWEPVSDRVWDLDKLTDNVWEGDAVEVLHWVRVTDTDAIPDFDSVTLADGERDVLTAGLADGAAGGDRD